MEALEVRFLDRFFDLHVMDRVQVAVGAALQRIAMAGADGHALARQRLERAYSFLEGRITGTAWSVGEGFTLAECAAAHALFYADWTHPISEAYPAVRAYRARLPARPSFAQAVEEARPYRAYFQLGAPDRD